MVVMSYIKGKVLDVGCGTNDLASNYRNCYGVDVHPWSNIDVLCDTGKLPFKDKSFESCTMLACLNHIPGPKREAVLKEVRRVIKADGLVVATMINPILGTIGHLTLWRWWDPDQCIAGMKDGEEFGLWDSQILEIFNDNGFRMVFKKTFVYGLNNVYIFQSKNKF
jgi:ubiquinone/menaquinone biosynthesis C-methylase UbiE